MYNDKINTHKHTRIPELPYFRALTPGPPEASSTLREDVPERVTSFTGKVVFYPDLRGFSNIRGYPGDMEPAVKPQQCAPGIFPADHVSSGPVTPPEAPSRHGSKRTIK